MGKVSAAGLLLLLALPRAAGFALKEGVSLPAAFPRTWSNPGGDVLLQHSENVWLAERPFVWQGIDVGGRCVICRLPSGGLWVHSPVALDDMLRGRLEAIGPVKHIVSPNYEHVKYASQWIQAYPEATSWVCPGGIAKFPDIPFAKEIPADAAEREGLFEGAVDTVFFDVEHNPFTRTPFFNECVFRFGTSLIATDLWWNWPSKEECPEVPVGTRLFRFGMDEIFLPFYNRLMVTDKGRFQRCLQEVADWRCTEMLLCHGLLITEDVERRVKEPYL